MDQLTLYLCRLGWLIRPAGRHRGDRGDVPGWVMVTVMTAGIVGALTIIVKPELSQMLRQALNSVQ